jgi:hypothetical protein
VVLALGSSGCQVLLGIDADPDIAVSADATSVGDGGTSEPYASDVAPHDAADAASHAIVDAAPDRASDARLNVYIYGKLDTGWEDDSTNATPDYADESITPRTAPAEIKLTVIRMGGAWGVRAPLLLDTANYQKLFFSLAPTMVNQTWICYLRSADGGTLAKMDVVGHGYADSLPLVGVFTDYTIPLSDLDAAATTISTVSIQDTSGNANNVWYVDDVVFGN